VVGTPLTATRVPIAIKRTLVAMMRKVFRANPFLELFPLKPCFNEMMTKTPFAIRAPAIHPNRGPRRKKKIFWNEITNQTRMFTKCKETPYRNKVKP